MTETNENRPLNCEEGLMRLLGLKTLEELDRVLSEPPDEKALETMGAPEELYAEDWKQDRADDAEIEQHEMETGQSEGTEALFATKDGKICVLWISTSPPAQFRGFEHFSRLVVLLEPSDLDAYDIAWSAFARRGDPGEFALFEEAHRYFGKERL
jgi:hypothetical protein